jgi:hypothetical protein
MPKCLPCRGCWASRKRSRQQLKKIQDVHAHGLAVLKKENAVIAPSLAIIYLMALLYHLRDRICEALKPEIVFEYNQQVLHEEHTAWLRKGAIAAGFARSNEEAITVAD